MEIKTIKIKVYGSGFSLVDTDLLNQLQADYKEAIGALELDIETFDVMKQFVNNLQAIEQMQNRRIKMIEKAYRGKWEDIRREK